MIIKNLGGSLGGGKIFMVVATTISRGIGLMVLFVVWTLVYYGR